MEVTTKEYINLNRIAGKLIKIYSKEVEDIRDDECRTVSGRAYLDAYWDDEHVRDYATMMAYKLNDEMKAYLNMKDHEIMGNFCNIDKDYPKYRGTLSSRKAINALDDMVDRLNDGDMSEQSVEDREFLTDWFFQAFGTFGLKYNFGNMLGEALYCIEEEN